MQMGPSLKSTVRKRQWAITSAPRLLVLMNAMTSQTFTNILKVSPNKMHTRILSQITSPYQKSFDLSCITYWITVTWHFWSFSGTEEERIAVETACRYGSKASAFSSSKAEDVSVEVTMDGQGPTMGNDAELTITVRNSSSEKRTVTLNSQAVVMYYTGVPKATVRKHTVEVDVPPKSGETAVLMKNILLS